MSNLNFFGDYRELYPIFFVIQWFLVNSKRKHNYDEY